MTKRILRIVSFAPILVILALAIRSEQLLNVNIVPLIAFWAIIPVGMFVLTSDEE